ncbi:MAG TPA: cbb3-type cytochrome c oxidase subunit I [Polyangiaceae bacterium]|nr:cbb3-type cytochrome c oxidase subunit I [Polyangiaceae bacterium]
MKLRSDRSSLGISTAWTQLAMLTFVIGFGILGYLAYRIYAEHPPVPAVTVAPNGETLFTRDDVFRGQMLFGQFGLMEYGTIFGHGAYLGPDFTADSIERERAAMRAYYVGQGAVNADARVVDDFKTNRWDSARDTLVFTPAQVAAWHDLQGYYSAWFGPASEQRGLRRPSIPTDQIRPLVAYFSWAAWVSTANRPGESYSYTNNWPPAEHAGNTLTADAVFWSGLSLVALLAGIGATLYAFGRFKDLGWPDEGPSREVAFHDPHEVRLTPGQRTTVWYFLVVAGLFLLQGLFGGANAHYHAEPEHFFGFDVASWFPYHLTRTWHLQLALFFVATSYLAIGIFLAPMIAGKEPRHQDSLAVALFVALVIVVVGSLAGEMLSYRGAMPSPMTAWWLGAQGWEYLDLGRLWQLALTVGLLLWLVIVARGLRSGLRGRHRGSMPWLFLYATLSIPLFYGVGMLFGPRSHFAVIDFWRFWVVHLWVEDFLEIFTTVTVAYMFVLIGMVPERVATRLIYLEVILYSIGGVVGTMHHLYFSGAPAVHMSLGAFFSAMEVIPLVLLTFEAWRFMRLGGARPGETVMAAGDERFPHKWAVMFLSAVGFWNFVGAGVFGFLINLPVVSYWEIGTQFTANHGHAAMMGVYGMLAMGFFVFVAVYFVPRDAKTERAMKWSFWSLNGGLAWMVCVNLFPIGALQLYDALVNGYWHARQPEFFARGDVRLLEWARLPGDVVFIAGGIAPLVYLAIRMVANRNRPELLPPEAAVPPLTHG